MGARFPSLNQGMFQQPGMQFSSQPQGEFGAGCKVSHLSKEPPLVLSVYTASQSWITCIKITLEIALKYQFLGPTKTEFDSSALEQGLENQSFKKSSR